MFRILSVVLVAITVVFSGLTARAADFQKGLDAALAGNYAIALREWVPLAEQGNARAQYGLGVMYAKGWGVLADDVEAVGWYRLAAEQGNSDAQNNLGVMYRDGKGVLADDVEAVRWYRLAAEQGAAKAQGNLGAMYGNGRGVMKDITLGYMWSHIASANGHQGSSALRASLEGEMTPEQIAEAMRRARVCMSSGYSDCD